MDRDEELKERPNSDAPPELSRFAFLIGRWRCEGKLKMEDGSWAPVEAWWLGRYALDGCVIIDEFKMAKPTGELMVLGVNVRAYDATKGAWVLKWLNALNATWLDLGPEALGGIEIAAQSISYVFQEPVATHALTRATYLDIEPNHFTWRGERSNDGRAWEEFLVLEARRTH